MSNRKWTGGEWKFVMSRNEEKNLTSCTVVANLPCDKVQICDLGFKEYGITGGIEAEGHLLSASKDLYLALERLYGKFLQCDRDGDIWITEEDGEIARLALAKADGSGAS